MMRAYFFLDSIPEEVLENVLRYFSRIPNSKNWETHIELSDLFELFAIRGGLGIFLRSRFDALIVSNTMQCYDESWLWGWKVPNKSHLWTDDIDAALTYVKAGGGEALKTLVVGYDMHETGGGGDNLVAEFREHCPNVTSMSASEEGDSCWARKFGAQLDILELLTAVPLDVPWRSTALRELNLTTYLADNKGMWRKIGFNLEKLVIIEFRPAENDVYRIKRYCPNLKSICLEGAEIIDIPAIVTLLASYGDQLEFAALAHFNESQLREVADACPNSRFHLVDKWGTLSACSLSLIGSRLEVVKLRDLVMNGDLDQWTNAWDSCTNIRDAYIKHPKSELIEVIFSTAKALLTSLRIDFRASDELEAVRKVMNVCAKGTKCVEKLVCAGPGFYGDTMSAFIERNLDTLNVISLAGNYNGEQRERDQLLKSVLKVPALEELDIGCKTSKEISKYLRKRGVCCRRISMW